MNRKSSLDATFYKVCKSNRFSLKIFFLYIIYVIFVSVFTIVSARIFCLSFFNFCVRVFSWLVRVFCLDFRYRLVSVLLVLLAFSVCLFAFIQFCKLFYIDFVFVNCYFSAPLRFDFCWPISVVESLEMKLFVWKIKPVKAATIITN